MPNPKKFKNEKEWMSACMPMLLHLEKKDRDQAIAQCLNMWRQKKKKARRIVDNYIKGVSIDMETKQRGATHRVLQAFLKEGRLRGDTVSPGQAKIIERQLREDKKQHWKNVEQPKLLSKEPVPKLGEKINMLYNDKFELTTITEEHLEKFKEDPGNWQFILVKTLEDKTPKDVEVLVEKK